MVKKKEPLPFFQIMQSQLRPWLMLLSKRVLFNHLMKYTAVNYPDLSAKVT